MLQLLQQRDEIQHEAQEVLRRKFHEFDIECVDVLIGKPDTAEVGGAGKIETLRQHGASLRRTETKIAENLVNQAGD